MEDRRLIIGNAIKVLESGGIIIFPTDTAFGIGCKVSDESAVKRLFKLRKRSELKAVPILINSLEIARRYSEDINEEVLRKLIKPFWPGALTIILKCKIENIPSLVRGRGNTIGLRIPNNKVILEIISGVGEGIIGCSANFSGDMTPYSLEEIDPELLKMVDYVVPGETTKKHESTVIDCTIEPWKVLRQGATKVQGSKLKVQGKSSKPKDIDVVLNIDTTSNQIIKVGLIINGRQDLREESHEKKKAQIVLPLIEELLQKHNLAVEHITKIQVNPGPGSFTGVRVGVAIANTLGYFLKIPINGKKVEELVEPVYS